MFAKLPYRTATTFLLTLFVAACSPPEIPKVSKEQMVAEGQGAIVFVVDLFHQNGCQERFHIGQFDSSIGAYRFTTHQRGYLYGASGVYFDRKIPGLAYLKEGSYGIISGVCVVGNGASIKTRGKTRKTGSGPDDIVWPNAIATFEVKTGEVTNIGRLSAVNTGLSIPDGRFKNFIDRSEITDIPAEQMEEFKKRHPELSKKIVTRLMKLPTGDLRE